LNKQCDDKRHVLKTGLQNRASSHNISNKIQDNVILTLEVGNKGCLVVHTCTHTYIHTYITRSDKAYTSLTRHGPLPRSLKTHMHTHTHTHTHAKILQGVERFHTGFETHTYAYDTKTHTHMHRYYKAWNAFSHQSSTHNSPNP
jgi:hypothetical protein